MAHVLGRDDDRGPAADLGSFRARDGSPGAPCRLDVDRPHAALVVGKRGYGKSYTLGVLAEELARASGVAPVVVDPMGVFRGLASGADDVDASVPASPTVRADAVPPRAWCGLLDLSPSSGPGALVWRAAADAASLSEMQATVEEADAAAEHRLAARNHLGLAATWGVFSPDGLAPADLLDGGATVLDLSGLSAAAMNAIVRAVALGLYDACVADAVDRLPWLLVDEAHAFFEGIAGPALRRVLTRGRQPGVSLVAATQRPSALPGVAVSQADLVLAHRLTSRADREALEAARPTYMGASFGERTPTEPGEVTLVDDATEAVRAVRVRKRDTPHGGASPRASETR
ncbi:ATP-binding protein [Halostella sp. JP-L12]|uniref:ATP-binding protein n=1 Tax=Halostella TaxID=1843185 RepID=UPI000EF83A4D|nr:MULTISPECIES: DUF87 domain-containing protein [Halostella]NHN48252.1 ATP-binding protein [Halostella sp. JP-L12]